MEQMICDPTSIRSFRPRLRSTLVNEVESGHRRDVVVLALDGIKFDLACALWPHASVTRLMSVYPTTSSTGWMSHLTGSAPSDHGIPGVVFLDDGDELINVFSHKGQLLRPDTGNIFSDAREIGFTPVAIVGDWEPFDCTWRDMLLEHAQRLQGYRFYTAPHRLRPREIVQSTVNAVNEARSIRPAASPLLVWCFVDVDQHIHFEGYDAAVVDLLHEVDRVATEMAGNNILVMAHSDHGLVSTDHSPDVAKALEAAQGEFRCRAGGCGRTRWLYSNPADRDAVIDTVRATFPAPVKVFPSEMVFPSASLGISRVGDVMIMATGNEFATFSGHRFDHGSVTPEEMEVPFATWGI